ncbi:MAG: trans-aconitate methyltransferase [Fibrobacteres bacterium]|nr:trans-aconitate methyltransferase [Fibrobacterota bacterium]
MGDSNPIEDRSGTVPAAKAVDAFAMPQTWDPDRYRANASFVAELGMPVVDLLAPMPGERILDLGCGDGALTAKLAAMGCQVLGVDASAAQIEAARKLGLDAQVADAENLTFAEEFDAVFSNATLHWIRKPDAAIDGVWRALKPGGRFVGECGGADCVARIRAALGRALSARGQDIQAVNPWYFATAEDYGARLRARGFRVESILVFPRPTPLPGDVRAWLETFAENFMKGIPSSGRGAFLAEVQEDLRPDLCDADGKWTADYTRLRFRAIKPGPGNL